jgi:hypothetical protein
VLDWLRDLLDRPLADAARTSIVAVAVVALVAVDAVLVFVAAPDMNDPEPKPGRDVSAPPPRHDADPASNSAPAPQRWPAGRERAVREYAADFLRWERGRLSSRNIRHVTPELRDQLGPPPRITPATRPPELAHNRHGLMGIAVYLEQDAAHVRVRVRDPGSHPDHMGGMGNGWEAFGVQLAHIHGRWMVTAHKS